MPAFDFSATLNSATTRSLNWRNGSVEITPCYELLLHAFCSNSFLPFSAGEIADFCLLAHESESMFFRWHTVLRVNGRHLESVGPRTISEYFEQVRRALMSFGSGQQNLPFGITYVMGLKVLNQAILGTCWFCLTN